MYDSPEDLQGTLIFVAVVITVIVLIILLRLSWKHHEHKRVRVSQGTSLLSALDSSTIFNGVELTTPRGVTGMCYLNLDTSIDSPGYQINIIALPFQTACHIIGIPTEQISILESIDSNLEKVSLEGDYNNFFQLFTEPGDQTNLRYILDPVAMTVSIDFFKNYYWEIHDNTLYISSYFESPDLDAIDRFIETIRPAIEIPNTTPNSPHSQPYHYTKSREIDCPVCQKKLIADTYWIGCPDGHGCIASDYQLTQLRDLHDTLYQRIAQYKPAQSTTRPTTLHCPYCFDHPQMNSQQYSTTTITLDTCPKCGHHWLDLDELARVTSQTR